MFANVLANKDLFVHRLSNQERTALVYAFAYLASLDHKLRQVELDPISMIAHSLNIDPRIIVEDVGTIELSNLLKPVEREQAKRIILQELINLAYADGEYSQEERTGMHHIAAMLRVEAALLARIEAWVQKGRAWKTEGDQLILGKERV